VAEAHDQLNRGWNVVLSIPDLGYLDMPYVPHPEEGGYDWASRSVDVHQIFGFMPDNLPANAALITDTLSRPKVIADEPRRDPGHGIAGIQAQLWSETIRTDAKVDYMFFPRLLALAERAWAPAPWAPKYVPGATYQWQDPRVDRKALDAGWRDFAGRLAAQLPLMDANEIAYRIAPPGAKIENGMLLANGALPGTIVEYRVPGGSWTQWTRPVAASGAVELRSRSTEAKRTSRIVSVSAN
jgi:hexosaminidase